MIALLALAWAEPAARFERVDLVVEHGDWLADDVPRTAYSPRGTALRGVEQVAVGVALPRASLVLGASLAGQSVAWRRPLTRRAPVYASVGVVTALGLPRGAFTGVEAWAGPVRIGFGVSAMSAASWARPAWDHWRVLPGVGLGVGRRPLPF